MIITQQITIIIKYKRSGYVTSTGRYNKKELGFRRELYKKEQPEGANVENVARYMEGKK